MSRAKKWIALGSLFAAYAVLSLLLSPFGMANGSPGIAWRLFIIGTTGAMIAPPLLLAIAAVIAPVPPIVRVPGTMVLVAVLAYAMALGILWGSPVRVAESSVLPFVYGVFLVPAFVVARLRRWRIVPEVRWGTLPRGQFSLYGLLAAVTAAGLTIAAGRWVMSLGQWPQSPAEWGAIAGRMTAVSLFISLGCFPVLACTAFVLAPAKRLRMFVVWIVSAVGALIILFALMAPVVGAPAGPDDIALVVSMALGVHGSSLVSLFVVRLCGFRLVRDARDTSADAALPRDDAEAPA